MPDIIGAAEYYQLRGLAVFPVSNKIPVTDHGVKDATLRLDEMLTQTRKRPDGTIKSSRKMTLAEWLTETGEIAIAVPEHMVVIDIDPRNGGDATVAKWLDDADEEMRAAFELAPCVQTRGGGWHYYFRYDGRALIKEIGGVDFQRIGKYVVAPPTAGYTFLNRMPDDMMWFVELPLQLYEIATPVERSVSANPDSARVSRNAGSVDELDEAAHRYTDWTDLLGRHGWAPAGQGRWRHPRSENTFSATITNDCLFVYSPNTPFPVTSDSDPHGVTLFRAISVLDFRGDDKATAAEFRRRGLLPDVRSAADLNRRMEQATHTPAERPQRVESVGDVAPNDDHGPRIQLVDMTGMTLRRVRWLWNNRIPTGALTLLAGREGEGKSTIAIDSMARVTRGRSRGEFEGTPKDTIIVATEDSFEHTIVPRLIASGADLSRVFRIDMLNPTDSLTLPVDLAELERAIAEKDVALIVLDPLLSRLDGRLDSHKDADVRRALEPLGAFADRTGVAILGLIHLNKGGSTDPLQAVMASRAFTAFARSVLFVMIDPENDNRRLLGVVKSNLGPLDLPTLTYTFEPIVVGDDDGPIVATRVLWGEDSTTRITEALSSAGVDPGAVMDAKAFLEGFLRDTGWALRSDMTKAMRAEQVEFSAKALERAAKKLGVVMERQRAQGAGTVWHYETITPPHEVMYPHAR